MLESSGEDEPDIYDVKGGLLAALYHKWIQFNRIEPRWLQTQAKIDFNFQFKTPL